MVRLVDDLLDVSRITRGKIELQCEPLDVAKIVTSAVETSRPLINDRKQELHLTLPPTPLFVEADPARLAQVISNLLNNAAKFTEEGGHIRVAVEREGAQVVFRVRDDGMGIPPEMLLHIFELFTQVNRSLDRNQGGLGIGLTLVHRLVEMHGGSVQALSEGPGRGSEFVVRLPALPEARVQQDNANGYCASAEPVPISRVLIVDDNADAADSLAMYLRLLGQEVRVANDGKMALEIAGSFRPSIVLLDIGLPGMDGYEVAQHLRRLPDANAMLLVALSGYGQANDRLRSQQVGIDHHLVKPVEPSVLNELLVSGRLRSHTDEVSASARSASHQSVLTT
jgi:two-component system CheB/CheR fusion protein